MPSPAGRESYLAKHGMPFTSKTMTIPALSPATAAKNSVKKAAKLFIGTHDFSSYMAADTKIKDTVRTVFDADVERKDGMIVFKVSADGFLYNMVRIFMGTLVDVGYGRLDPKDIVGITEACDRSRAGSTAPAHGLFLNRVVY